VATRFEIGGAVARAFEQHREQLGRQQPDILGEKAEKQPHQKVRGALGVNASRSQGVREGCELGGGHLRYIRRAAIGPEPGGIGEHRAKNHDRRKLAVGGRLVLKQVVK
jgi:hypothetical protein